MYRSDIVRLSNIHEVISQLFEYLIIILTIKRIKYYFLQFTLKPVYNCLKIGTEKCYMKLIKGNPSLKIFIFHNFIYFSITIA